jgi:hypothetical protein
MLSHSIQSKEIRIFGQIAPATLGSNRQEERSEMIAANGKAELRGRIRNTGETGPTYPTGEVYALRKLGLLLVAFQTYKNCSSVAVATFSFAFRVARFKAERTFSLVSPSSIKGTRRAAPAFSWSRSRRIIVTIALCLPFRERGTSPRSSVLKWAAARVVFTVRLRTANVQLTLRIDITDVVRRTTEMSERKHILSGPCRFRKTAPVALTASSFCLNGRRVNVETF